MNTIVEIAKARNRDYVTPEDVSEAIESMIDLSVIRLDVLEIIGSHYAAEDISLCAFVA